MSRDAGRFRKSYSFYRPPPVPTTTTVQQGSLFVSDDSELLFVDSDGTQYHAEPVVNEDGWLVNDAGKLIITVS